MIDGVQTEGLIEYAPRPHARPLPQFGEVPECARFDIATREDCDGDDVEDEFDNVRRLSGARSTGSLVYMYLEAPYKRTGCGISASPATLGSKASNCDKVRFQGPSAGQWGVLDQVLVKCSE